MERVHELNQLRGFQVVLSSFLKRFCDTQSEKINLLEGIEKLDRIVAESGGGGVKGKTDTAAAVDEWMQSYMQLAKRSSLAPEDRERISALLLELQRKSDEPASEERMNAEINSLAELRQKIANWRDRSEAGEMMSETQTIPFAKLDSMKVPVTSRARSVSVEPKRTSGPRRIVLKRRSETDQPDLTGRYIEMLWSELEYFEQNSLKGQHALSWLNDMLNCAETKTDPMYLHLAGSFIYFLRREGYKMAPYVKRLRNIEKRLETARENYPIRGRSLQANAPA